MTATAGCSLDAEEVHASRTFPHTGDSLKIDVPMGGVRVLPGSQGTVQVERWLRGKAATDDPSWSLRDGTLRLSAGCNLVFGDCGARYHVKVPPGVRLSVEAEDGVILNGLAQDVDAVSHENIEVDRASGRLRLRSEGPVRGTGLTSRDVRVRTDYGAINLAFTSRPGKLDLKSNDGPVTARVPSGAYAVTAVTETGRRQTEVEHDRHADATIVARSDTGDVRILKK
ncbi:hypothetical protein [Nonomuraea sp. NPDC049309]|uniref:hypothetical protein n=1 Tax=Nonomuraea sp. NPDC049309 TaxID=3364350 RepID=UPI003720BED5